MQEGQPRQELQQTRWVQTQRREQSWRHRPMIVARSLLVAGSVQQGGGQPSQEQQLGQRRIL